MTSWAAALGWTMFGFSERNGLDLGDTHPAFDDEKGRYY